MTYAGEFSVDLPDRTLAHIQVVVSTKLRRGEPFFFTWELPPPVGSGRQSVWVSSSSMLVFHYSGRPPADVNTEWINELAHTANSPGGMHLVPEPDRTYRPSN